MLKSHPGADVLGAMTRDFGASVERIVLRSRDPDDLTLREARWLANADRIVAAAAVPTAILNRARADAERADAVVPGAPGLTVIVEMP